MFADRLLWVGFTERRVLDALALVERATAAKWHPKRFRIYWRWRSCCPGRPKASDEIRGLFSIDSRLIYGEFVNLPMLSLSRIAGAAGFCHSCLVSLAEALSSVAPLALYG